MKIICGISNYSDIENNLVFTSAVILDLKNPVHELDRVFEYPENINIAKIIKEKALAFSTCVINYKENNLSFTEAKCLGMLHVYNDLNIGIDEIWIADFYRPAEWKDDKKVFNFLEGITTKDEIIASSVLAKEAYRCNI